MASDTGVVEYLSTMLGDPDLLLILRSSGAITADQLDRAIALSALAVPAWDGHASMLQDLAMIACS